MKMLPDFHRWAFRFLHNSYDRTKSHSGPGGQKLRKDRNLELLESVMNEEVFQNSYCQSVSQ